MYFFNLKVKGLSLVEWLMRDCNRYFFTFVLYYDQADKVEYISHIKEIPLKESRNAAMALFCRLSVGRDHLVTSRAHIQSHTDEHRPSQLGQVHYTAQMHSYLQYRCVHTHA